MQDTIQEKKVIKKVPKLRFPGFSDDWEEKKFGEFFFFLPTNSFSREDLNYNGGKVRNIHYGDIHTKFRTHFDINREAVPFVNSEISLNKNRLASYYCKTGDLIVADASEDYADIGKCIEIINLNNEKVLAGLHTLHARPDKNSFFVGFSGYLMKARSVHLQVMKIAQGTKVLSISPGRLADVYLDIPDIEEQQKIAGFLGAVDEWIENLKKQKENFEAYKKGMMQKIFSQEIRFKPARNASHSDAGGDDNGKSFSKWEEKKLGDVCDISTAPYIEPERNRQNGYYLIDMGAVLADGRLSAQKRTSGTKNMLRMGDLVMPNRDIGHGDIIGKVALIDLDGKYVLGNNMYKITPKSDLLSMFLFFLINSESVNHEMRRRANGTSQLQLIRKDVDSVKFLIPLPKEQKKIAEFLTSIDKIIESKQQQITQAEAWKRGLMQGLFI